MVCRTEIVEDRIYDYCPDPLPPAADRLQAIMRGRFVDELTGQGMKAQLIVRTQLAELLPRVSLDGIAGLVGNPARRFPGLLGNSVEIDMTVSATGYLSASFSRTLGPINTGSGAAGDYPNFFAPLDLGQVGMHRSATWIKGRCVQNNGTARVPVDGATVEIANLWHQFPAAHVDPLLALEAANIVFVWPGLYANRLAGTDLIRARDLSPAVGEEKLLLSTIAAGVSRIELSDRVNLNPGDLLSIDLSALDLLETIEVLSVQGASTASQAATVILAYPVKNEHRTGATAVRVFPQAPGANNNLIRSGIVADQTLFLDALADISNSTVEITDGIAAPEYHNVSLYNVISDVAGYFRLPPMSRIAQLEIIASRFDLTSSPRMTFSPDYNLVENRIDLVFE